MKKINYPCIVTIAGTDPSGGAGIQADIKAISATGGYAASVITALVSQNTQGVQAILAVPADFVAQQISSVFDDLTVSAVKIGMLHSEEVMAVVAASLQKLKPKNIVLDPVMIAKKGAELLHPSAVNFLKENIFPHVNLVTPNLHEAEKLTGKNIVTRIQMEECAKQMGQKYQFNVLIKGGHLEENSCSDVLYLHESDELMWFEAERIVTRNTHGTGCSLSAAIASYLGRGFDLSEAVRLAKHYLNKAIQSGSQLHIGQGCGPVDHFYFLKEIPL